MEQITCLLCLLPSDASDVLGIAVGVPPRAVARAVNICRNCATAIAPALVSFAAGDDQDGQAKE